MKIVHLSYSDMGGAGVAARRLHLFLREAGIDSNFLSLIGHAKPFPAHTVFEASRERFRNRWLNRVHGALTRRLPALFRTEEWLLSNRPAGYEHFSFPYSGLHIEKHPLVRSADVVHLHWVADGMIDYRSFFSSVKQPVLWTLHDMNPFTGGCHHSDGSPGFIKDCIDCPQMRNTPDEQVATKNLRYKLKALRDKSSSSVRIVTPSGWLGELSAKSALFRRFTHDVIPNPADERIFRPHDKQQCRKEFRIPLESRVILFVAYHVENERKGIRALMEAINALPGNDIVVLTAGHEMQDKKLNKTIIQAGFVKDEEKMAKLYSAADIFVLPSVAENFPNTIVESLLCGTPVCASNVGGIPEQINRDNGILFDVNESGSLVRALKDALYEKQFDRERMREDAVAKYGHQSVTAQYRQVYSELVNEAVDRHR